MALLASLLLVVVQVDADRPVHPMVSAELETPAVPTGSVEMVLVAAAAMARVVQEPVQPMAAVRLAAMEPAAIPAAKARRA